MMDIIKIYDKNYFESINYSEVKEAKKNFIRIFKLFKWNPNTVLDVGCGKGCFVQLLRSKRIEALGMDFSEYAGTLIPEWFIQSDATQPFPFEDKQFDVVVASAFFEHLKEEDIDKVYEEMKRVGKKIMAVIGHKSKLSNGVQTHLTIKNREWWQNKLPEVEMIN